MTNSKYYTPRIKEFYIGFRFQYLNSGGKLLKDHPDNWERWENEVVDKDWFIRILEDFEENSDESLDMRTISHYRVKHLDQEDLEELGWEQVKKNYFVFHKKSFWGCDGIDNKFVLTLIPTMGGPRTVLKRYDSGGFAGMVDNLAYILDGLIIKNYNEMERLMKQLDIA